MSHFVALLVYTLILAICLIPTAIVYYVYKYLQLDRKIKERERNRDY